MRQFAQLSLVLLAASQISRRPAAYAQQADNRVSLNFVDTDIRRAARAVALHAATSWWTRASRQAHAGLGPSGGQQPGPVHADRRAAPAGLRHRRCGRRDRVVPEADAKLQGSAVVGDPRPAAKRAGVGPASRARRRRRDADPRVPAQYENAANLVPVLRPMVPPNNPVNAYPGNNTLVVTDYADNLERIAAVIARDVPSSIDTDVVPVRSGIASDIAVLASQLLDTQTRPSASRWWPTRAATACWCAPAVRTGARTDPEAGRAAEPRRQPAWSICNAQEPPASPRCWAAC